MNDIPQPIAKPYLSAITGLRFLAAFMVLIDHLRGQFGLPSNYRHFGVLAVSFFFVLSGFILTYVTYGKFNQPGSVFKFYVKRFARIWPVHLVLLLVTVFLLDFNFDWLRFTVNALLLQSWIPIDPWVFSYNAIAWSISTEMFFYVMLPVFLIGGKKQFWWKFGLLICVVAGMIGYAQHLEHTTKISFDTLLRFVHANPLVRLPEFCVGIATALFMLQRSSALETQVDQSTSKPKSNSFVIDSIKEIAVLTLICIYGYYFEEFKVLQLESSGLGISQWFYFSGASLIFAVAIYVMTQSKGLLARFFDSKPLTFLGQASYSLFMVHFMVIVFYKGFDWSGTRIQSLWIAAAIISISICLSILLYKFVEDPARSAIIHLSQRCWKECFVEFWQPLKNYLPTAACWAWIMVLITTIYAMHSIYQPVAITPAMQIVIDQTDGDLQNASFGGCLRLMGCQSKATDGGIEVTMVWQARRPIVHSRFMHVVDANDDVLFQLGAESKLYQQAELGKPFVEVVTIPAEWGLESTRIGVGFYCEQINPETGKQMEMLSVDRGPVSLEGFRLDVVGAGRMQSLRKP